jgi:signal transduction histidine kinase/DNA-binding response OmpR family regulator
MYPSTDTAFHIESPARVLIADDITAARLLLRRILEREGLIVSEADSAESAVEQAISWHPELILMDVQMPGPMDGFEALRVLRNDKRTTRIPVIVLSAAARDPQDIEKGFGLGADDYIVKPFNTNELVARVKTKVRAYRLETKLQERTTELEALARVGQSMNQALQLDSVADKLFDMARQRFPDAHLYLALTDKQMQPLVERRHLVDGPTQDQLAPHTLPGFVLAWGETVLVRSLSAAMPSVIFAGDPPGCQSGLGVAFIHMEKVLGVLALGSLKAGAFSSSDQRFLRSVAEQAALAVRNAQLFVELQQYVDNLEGMVRTRTDALRDAETQLIRADKLAALGTLAAGIAHEINNPLQAVLMNLELAIEDVDSERQVDRELLEQGKSEVQRIVRLVMRLLDFARPARQEITLISLNPVIEEVIVLLAHRLRNARVRVHKELNSNRTIMGSGDQLRQVLLNLVVNAQEAMPSGGDITIATGERYDDGEEPQLLLIVEDTGMGIAPENLEKIFNPFYTTKTNGNGLGMAVTHTIIESHGGKIWVESALGKGTRFTIALPLHHERQD